MVVASLNMSASTLADDGPDHHWQSCAKNEGRRRTDVEAPAVRRSGIQLIVLPSNMDAYDSLMLARFNSMGPLSAMQDFDPKTRRFEAKGLSVLRLPLRATTSRSSS